MIKALSKYLLYACILLLSGHSFLYANTHEKCVDYISIKTLETPGYTGFNVFQNNLTSTIESVSPGTEKESYEMKNFLVCDDNDDNEDDDESISLKKDSGNNNCPASIFPAQTPGQFSRSYKKIVPYYQHVSNSSSYRYLLFRVFRI